MPRSALGFMHLVGLLIGMLAIGGCEPISHISWSPDGARAAYFVPVQGKLVPGVSYVLDADGKKMASLGPTFGSFAWSPDSKSIYFGAYDNQQPATVPIERKWLVDAEDQQPPEAPANDEFPPMVLTRWSDGKAERLAPVGNRYVVFVQLSPDQNWVAVMTSAKETGTDGRPQLFVYNVASKKLYAVSDYCGNAMCFTGPDRLAYVETMRDHHQPLQTGQIIEVKLDESSEQLERTPLVDLIPSTTTFMQPTGDGLLFTTVAASVPVKASKENEHRPPGLFHYTRANGGVTAMAEATEQLFMPSPDGKRILYIKLTPASEKMPLKRELCVMNANGSDEHVLRDLTIFGQQPPMWPGWRGNDEITFVGSKAEDQPVQEGKDPRIAFDVVQYKINAQGALEPIKTLSDGWPIEMKPSMKKSDYTAPVSN
ncbi:MAG TPA: hypothetical protein VLI90_02330 [Tepidisphaeraceae bacterium]|nr:hypothetical protein [Tepidisphaeraceae bacterium]